MARSKSRSGSMTVTVDADVDIYVRDIIENLSDFGEGELEDLRDAIDREIGESDNGQIFGASNLEEEQKIKILKELFHKCTWQELEKIKNSL